MTLGVRTVTQMSDHDEKPNTIYLTSAYVRRADAIARAMTPPNGIQPKRSAVVQKAIDDLFLSLGLTDKTNDICESQVAA
jgi:hypothetical protein